MPLKATPITVTISRSADVQDTNIENISTNNSSDSVWF